MRLGLARTRTDVGTLHAVPLKADGSSAARPTALLLRRSALLLRWRRGELLLRCGKMLLRVQVLLLIGELILERADFAAQLVILANAC